MICDCCGHDDGEPEIIEPVRTPEEIREARIIHEFKSRINPTYAAFAEKQRAFESSIMFGAGALAEMVGPIFQHGREIPSPRWMR